MAAEQICNVICDIKCPKLKGVRDPVTEELFGKGCELIGKVVGILLEFFQGCCHEDDAWLTIRASETKHADGNSLEISYYRYNGERDDDSLGSISRGETDTWREDLDSSHLRAIELRVDETDDICVVEFAFKVGKEPSGTGREETITLSSYEIFYLVESRSPVKPDCIWFGDENLSVGNFYFHWPSALRCFKNYKFYGSLDYVICMQKAMYSYDVMINGRYRRYRYSDSPSLPNSWANPFNRYRNMRYNSGHMCMDLSNRKTANRTPVTLVRCKTNEPAQQWDVDVDGRIRSRVNPSKCMEAGQTNTLYAKMYIYTCHNGMHQRW
eukprot:CAMPEP_0172483830 /NCGR_PEP_ID=MMETSP1066-20121228/11007_1 /TAXON_ID=671091 /ORGANISM="Coscinodiscus wailesii, Strain CCMP2513" /LENGTH=324 /DNA_ID=CAMNT_0013247963 /DNA_START=626 /DNA_END=1597 /DNA_ORIENTATION=-